MKKLVSLITSETFLIICISTYTLLLTKFPSVYHALNTPPGYWFVGHISWFDAWDIQVYLSSIRYGQNTGIFLQNPYTTITHSGLFIYQYYTILGVINRFLNISTISIFHISSIISSLFLIIAIYIIIKNFIREKLIRIAAFTSAIAGGGLGWIPLLNNSSADIISAGFTTLNAFERGHDALSTASLLLSFYLFIKFSQSKKKNLLVLATLFGLLNCAIHPPFILLYAIAGFLISIVQYLTDKQKSIFLFPITICAVFSLYYIVFLTGLPDNPGFAGITNQQLTPVKFFSLLNGFGLLLVFLVWNIVYLLDENLEMLYVKILFMIQIFLLFSPIGASLYFLKGLYSLGALISYYGIQTLIRKKQTKIAIIYLVLISSLISRLWIFNAQINVDKNNSFFFLKSSEQAALSHMNTFPTINILSLYRIGNYIPAHTNNRVYFGHNLQTPNGHEKLQTALSFYSTMNNLERDKFIAKNKIDYIYYGLEELEADVKGNMSLSKYFKDKKVIYRENQIVIYQK